MVARLLIIAALLAGCGGPDPKDCSAAAQACGVDRSLNGVVWYTCPAGVAPPQYPQDTCSGPDPKNACEDVWFCWVRP